MKILMSISLIVVLISGCKEDKLIEFNTDKSYIYFAYMEEQTGSEKYTDSVFYSFAMDEDLELTEKEIKIPIKIGGLASSSNREYKFEIDESSSYDPAVVSLSKAEISANKYEDTLRIVFKRVPEMREKQMEIKLNLVENNQFQLGNKFNNSIKIVCSDVLKAPSWWAEWQRFFGPFYKEVYQKWMQIYYLGADPSPHLYEGTPGPVYYWDYMPPALTSSFPITFMYIRILKEFFENNIIYPNGDDTKERILLP